MAEKTDVKAHVSPTSSDRETEEETDESSDAESDSNEESGETDDGEAIDEEPRIRYDRVRQDVTEILKNDAASCLAAHPKFLALGTHRGVVHVLDHQGNNIRAKEFPAHMTTVNALSIDENGEYIASCSDDGQVVINGLYSTDYNTKSTHDFPIRSVAIDPHFGRSRSSRQYVIGGSDQLILHERSLFGIRSKKTLLHAGEGPVRTIKWHGSFIAWANDFGVKIYDCVSHSRISYVARDQVDLRPEIYQCNLYWKDETTLLIGWANSIKLCQIRERPPDDVRDLPHRYVELHQHFQIDPYVAGIAMIDNNLAVLSYITNDKVQKTTKAQRPQLQIISSQDGTPLEMAADILSIRGYEEYRCIDYRLEVAHENLLFIVSPKDIIMAKPRDIKDHIEWQVQHGNYEEALLMAKQNEKAVKVFTAAKVGGLFLDALIKRGEYQKAASICNEVLDNGKQKWENVVLDFAEHKELASIAPYMPQGKPIKLAPALYEMVLNDFLQCNPPEFVKLLKAWSSDLYSVPTMTRVVQTALDNDPENSTLLEAQAHLYVAEGEYSTEMQANKAFSIDQSESPQKGLESVLQRSQSGLLRLRQENETLVQCGETAQQKHDIEIQQFQEEQRRLLGQLGASERMSAEMKMEVERLQKEKDDVAQAGERILRESQEKRRGLETDLVIARKTVTEVQIQLDGFMDPLAINTEDLVIGGWRLGGGSYGNVFAGMWKGLPVAVKKFHDVLHSDYYSKLFSQELAVLSRLHHPNILQLCGSIAVQDSPLILVMELLEGSIMEVLAAAVASRRRLSLRERIDLAENCCCGIAYLHQLKPTPYIHCDIRPSNMLVTRAMVAKVGDLGGAHVVGASTSAGLVSPNYIAPERQEEGSRSSIESDIYSLGVTIAEIFTGEAADKTKRFHQLGSIDRRFVRNLCLKAITDKSEKRPAALVMLHDIQSQKKSTDYIRCPPRRVVEREAEKEKVLLLDVAGSK